MNQKKKYFSTAIFYILITVIGSASILLIVNLIVPAIFHFHPLIESSSLVTVRNIQPACLHISPQEIRLNQGDKFLIDNQCGGAISVLYENPEQPQSSGSVGHLLTEEEQKFFENGYVVLQTSLESRGLILNWARLGEITFLPTPPTFSKHWSIKGMVGNQPFLIDGTTRDLQGFIISILRIIFILGFTIFVILIILRLIIKKIAKYHPSEEKGSLE